MGIGAAVSVVGGVMQMGASRKAAKAGQQAAAMQSQYMQMAQQAMEQAYGDAEGQLTQIKPYIDQQMQLIDSFQEMMGIISDEYGDYANNMWKDWEQTFGDIRGNLVEYYQNLDPLKYSTQMKAAIGQEIDKSMDQFNQAAAQSGIYTSGMGLQAQKEAMFNKAQANAQADIAAPDIVAGMQNQFYGQYGEPYRQQAQNMLGAAILNKGQMANMGLQAGQQGLNNYSNYYGNLANLYQNKGRDLSNIYTGQANQYGQSAAGYGASAGQLGGRGMNNLMSGMGSMFGGGGAFAGPTVGTALGWFSDIRLKKNITKIGEDKGYNIYSWDWEDEALPLVGDTPTTGVLAQEVIEVNPQAVSIDPSGYLRVNYRRL